MGESEEVGSETIGREPMNFSKQDEFIVKAAHQFILGRISQDVTILVGWLDTHWLKLSEDTRQTILKRTRTALNNGKCGGAAECKLWEDFLRRHL